jgi:hypothetical protein
VFKIRREQAQAFREDALRDFEDRVVSHVARCFPDRHAALGQAEVHAVVRRAIDRAGSYGIVAERDVCMFADLMLALGDTFDRDEPWAAAILARRGVDPTTTLRTLFARAVEGA